MNIGNSIYWGVERSVGAKVVRGVDVETDSDFGAKVGSGDGEVFE